jgi:hypothetical protein
LRQTVRLGYKMSSASPYGAGGGCGFDFLIILIFVR